MIISGSKLRPVGKFGCGKTFLGMVILMHVVAGLFTVVICSFDFNESEHADDHHPPQIHCGIDLDHFVPAKNGSSFLGYLASCLALLPQISEPYLPIVSFSIFKIPKPA
jgi:hypothetical protein